MTERDWTKPISESQTGVAKAYSQVPLLYTGAVIIGHHIGTVGAERAQVRVASGVYIVLDGTPLLVISDHVLDVYESFIREDDRALFQFGDEQLRPLDRLISRSSKSDIATLNLSGLNPTRLSAPLSASLGLNVKSDASPPMPPLTAYAPSRWPPTDVVEQDVVFIGGFPEQTMRLTDDGWGLSHQPFTIAGAIVTSLTAYPPAFKCRYEVGEATVLFTDDRHISGQPGANVMPTDFSGMSGCPVFRDPGPNGIAMDLIGFVRSGQPTLGTLDCTAATNIHLDGKVD